MSSGRGNQATTRGKAKVASSNPLKSTGSLHQAPTAPVAQQKQRGVKKGKLRESNQHDNDEYYHLEEDSLEESVMDNEQEEDSFSGSEPVHPTQKLRQRIVKSSKSAPKLKAEPEPEPEVARPRQPQDAAAKAGSSQFILLVGLGIFIIGALVWASTTRYATLDHLRASDDATITSFSSTHRSNNHGCGRFNKTVFEQLSRFDMPHQELDKCLDRLRGHDFKKPLNFHIRVIDTVFSDFKKTLLNNVASQLSLPKWAHLDFQGTTSGDAVVASLTKVAKKLKSHPPDRSCAHALISVDVTKGLSDDVRAALEEPMDDTKPSVFLKDDKDSMSTKQWIFIFYGESNDIAFVKSLANAEGQLKLREMHKADWTARFVQRINTYCGLY